MLHLGGNHIAAPRGDPHSRSAIHLLRPLRRLPPGGFQLRLTDVRRSTDGPHHVYDMAAVQQRGPVENVVSASIMENIVEQKLWVITDWLC